MSVPRLHTATAEDAQSIRILLERSGLPTSDLNSSKPEFIVAYEDAELIGAGALQRFETIALLRSVAVSSGRRGGGIGRLMVQELERRAGGGAALQRALSVHRKFRPQHPGGEPDQPLGPGVLSWTERRHSSPRRRAPGRPRAAQADETSDGRAAQQELG